MMSLTRSGSADRRAHAGAGRLDADAHRLVQPRRVADRVPDARGRRLLLGVRGGLEADRDAQVAATGRERNPPEGGVG